MSVLHTNVCPPSYFPEIFEDNDKGHGRIETRLCESLGNIEWLTERHPSWKGLKSVAKVTSIRRIGTNETTATRYYISSKESNAKEHLARSRSHWSIENNLHWVLDVQFNEDGCFIRKNNAAENMAAIRKMALNIIKLYKKQAGGRAEKRSIKGNRRMFGWDDGRMADVIASWVENCSWKSPR